MNQRRKYSRIKSCTNASMMIGRLQAPCDDLSLHKKKKETAGLYSKQIFSILTNEYNKIARDVEETKII